MTDRPTSRRQRRIFAWIKLHLQPRRALRFAIYTGRRFLADDCLRSAASLSYATLLALVPLMAIGLAILSGFPVFKALEGQIQDLILGSFLPETSAAVSDHLAGFVENTRQMTGPGVLALAVTALLLLVNINTALNAIWRVTEPRSLGLQILVYWTMLTLGPLLLGASLSLSGYAFAMVEWAGIEDYPNAIVAFSGLISVFLAALGFSAFYLVVPTRSVRLHHALAGGVLAAVVLEALKYGFGIYLRLFPTYEAIYGALSAIPIFLVWMYLAWAVVLLGAEVTAALPEWRAAVSRGRRELQAGERLALALTILQRLRAAQLEGRRLRSRELAKGLPVTPAELDDSLWRLREHGLAVRAVSGGWLLARDLSTVTLGALGGLLGLRLELNENWPSTAAIVVAGLAEAGRASLDSSLEDVLAETPPVAEATLDLAVGEGD
ncbi:MAG: YihY family inner membrane protein [Kiloniellales bacterium]|nr:YihY family inner membrane protein [Kiloniellales bacterium]